VFFEVLSVPNVNSLKFIISGFIGSKCTVFVSGKSKSSKTISGLAKGKYYFRIATYKTIGNARYYTLQMKAKYP